ncbi:MULTISPECIES: hypothetical protein [Rhizobium]|nr:MULTISPECIES: hypothetical protein [Rhizobium]MBB3290293.1 hypothetical protein [Rhizobium sp. BK252]MBB3405074.1 hypothetical protein [Rhizobium sp. BK289]MBB3417620.1 hypothetical protein [Rhizobium sp. BK284]MBB3485499.1 hypothetical protein [Rhizobium sp. BK347]MDK4719951.1 hypothetical protein [Rhizobium sp. CNPSo 3968]
MTMYARLRSRPGRRAEVVSHRYTLLSGITIDSPHIRDSRELVHQQRLDIGNISCLNMPRVKGTAPEGLTDLMKADPSPEFGQAVAFYIAHPDRFACLMLQDLVYA